MQLYTRINKLWDSAVFCAAFIAYTSRPFVHKIIRFYFTFTTICKMWRSCQHFGPIRQKNLWWRPVLPASLASTNTLHVTSYLPNANRTRGPTASVNDAILPPSGPSVSYSVTKTFAQRLTAGKSPIVASFSFTINRCDSINPLKPSVVRWLGLHFECQKLKMVGYVCMA